MREEIAGEMHPFMLQLVLDRYALRSAQQYRHHLAVSFHQPLLLKDLPEISGMFWFGNDAKLLIAFQLVTNVVEANKDTFLVSISSVGSMRLWWINHQIEPHILYLLAIFHLLPQQENRFPNVFLFALGFGFGRQAYGAAGTAEIVRLRGFGSEKLQSSSPSPSSSTLNKRLTNICAASFFIGSESPQNGCSTFPSRHRPAIDWWPRSHGHRLRWKTFEESPLISISDVRGRRSTVASSSVLNMKIRDVDEGIEHDKAGVLSPWQSQLLAAHAVLIS
mmetsp:Transcript_30097/g.49766  ORF Transcript_30097/g.49766 Transcript_30097/m.49766 type:complete len:277 (-) Transcript_30097:68-898(-)